MIFVLDNIRSKFNIWSIFRISDTFQIEKIVLTWFSVYPPDIDISKTAIWAENFVKWEYYQNTEDVIKNYKKDSRKIIWIEINDKAIPINKYNFVWNEVFIFWNEISWISEKILSQCDEIIKIPINWEIKESLNVWVTAWIVWAFVSLRS